MTSNIHVAGLLPGLKAGVPGMPLKYVIKCSLPDPKGPKKTV
jgi:hypothetical protein